MDSWKHDNTIYEEYTRKRNMDFTFGDERNTSVTITLFRVKESVR